MRTPIARQQLFDPSPFRGRLAGRTAPPGQLFDTSDYARPAAAMPAPEPSRSGGRSLKMFMTPREIHEGWQPLDADRESSNYGPEEGSYQPKSWETGRTFPTDINEVGTQTQDVANRRVRGYHYGAAGNDSGTIRRTSQGGKYRIFADQDTDESDEELWDRKLNEAQDWGRHGQHGEYGGNESDPLYSAHSTMGSYEGQPTVRPGDAGPSSTAWDRHDERVNSWDNRRAERRMDQGESLYSSIANEGVKGPIRLGSEIGSQGKPQIVGGHHRLAAATEAAPNRFVPVLHDYDIWSAREQAKRGGYPYS